MNATDVIFLGLLAALLLPISLTDLRERRIPNLLNAAVAVLGLAHALARNPALSTLVVVLLQFTLAAALFIGTTFLVRLVNKSAYIGWGDLKFLAACSLWVGVDGSVLVLVLACVFYLLLALAAAPWRGLDMRQMRPFGPMLALGMAVVVTAVFLRAGEGITPSSPAALQ